ncbi:MAG: succinate dehydrogenase assembly factor 2 [Rhodospirillaceae bacterium]|jgi:antitoxin CptB|nr:succinate dehydrogenase assembly factor 2 [Rhodospirillaceae bacterium]MBT6116960.1 succinate dehydrogenase assembly factor 2 [Rhodospirillaceae bacterium]
MSGEPDARRRRLLYRSRHRGTREMDLLIGGFAESHLCGMSGPELEEFERILEFADPDLYAWLTGQVPVPADCDGPIMARLREFRLPKAGA